MNLSELNAQQNKAVLDSYDKDTLLLAGAGAGKTRVITYRVGYLREDMKVPSSNIMMLTFTNKAAAEMRERLEKMNVDIKDIWTGTFHSVCVRILKRFGNKMGLNNFTILDSLDSKSVMGEALGNLLLPTETESIKKYLSRISSHKNDFIKPTEVITNATAKGDSNERIEGLVYKEYQDICWSRGYLDFDDLLVYTIVLLQTSNDVRQWFHDNIKYILCDEAQDSNKCQIMLIKLLQGPHTNVFAVGDIDQSIYGWRNARPEYLVNFDKLFANSKVLKLEQNYRSTQTIINASNNVIENNTFRLPKNIFTTNPVGSRITLKNCTNNNEEGLYIASEIKYLTSQGKDLKDIAVLYRTNDQSRAIEDALLALGVDYHLIGGVGFYNRKEIKDIMAFLRLKNNPNDEPAFKRVLKMQKGIGDKTVADLINIARSNNISLVTTMNAVTEPRRILPTLRFISDLLSKPCNNIFDYMKLIVDNTKMIERFVAEDTEESLGRRDNVNELLNIAKQNENMKLSDFVDQVALSTKEDGNTNPNSVTLMTVHSAKGLEYDTIFIAGAEENILPHVNSKGNEKDLEEERRIMYVAMTRAKTKLYISHCDVRRKFDKTMCNSLSRFVKEIDDKYLNKI